MEDNDKPSKRVKLAQDTIEFDLRFYQAIAEAPDFEIIPFPYVYSEQEKEELIEAAREDNVPILYTIDSGEYEIMFSLDTGKTGYFSKNHPDGFPC